MSEDICPVAALVPRDAVRRVNFDRHNLADLPALDEDHRRADTARLTTPVLATLDVICDERIVVCHVRPRDDVCALNGESVGELPSGSEFSHQVEREGIGAHLLLGSLEGR